MQTGESRFTGWLSRIPADFGQTDHSTLNRVFIPAMIAQLLLVARFGDLTAFSAPALFLAGGAFWTLEEYLLHRFSFHARSEHALVKPFNSGLHLLHHRSPSDNLYLGAPLVLTIPVYALTLAVLRALTGGWDRAAVFGSGLTLGFLVYEHVHFTVHQSTPMRGPVMRYLKKHHMTHHFADKEKLFGVTSPAWDAVFGTLSARPANGGKPAKSPAKTPAAASGTAP